MNLEFSFPKHAKKKTMIPLNWTQCQHKVSCYLCMSIFIADLLLKDIHVYPIGWKMIGKILKFLELLWRIIAQITVPEGDINFSLVAFWYRANHYQII